MAIILFPPSLGKRVDASEVGRIDLLCKDRGGMCVVIRLKKDCKSDGTVGHIIRTYAESRAYEPGVRGIIVSEPDPKIEHALEPLETLIGSKFSRVNFEAQWPIASADNPLNKNL